MIPTSDLVGDTGGTGVMGVSGLVSIVTPASPLMLSCGVKGCFISLNVILK